MQKINYYIFCNIPTFCPLCGSKMNIIDARISEAKFILGYCSKPKCKFCIDKYF